MNLDTDTKNNSEFVNSEYKSSTDFVKHSITSLSKNYVKLRTMPTEGTPTTTTVPLALSATDVPKFWFDSP
jgi:hypothetical protein